MFSEDRFLWLPQHHIMILLLSCYLLHVLIHLKMADQAIENFTSLIIFAEKALDVACYAGNEGRSLQKLTLFSSVNSMELFTSK